MLKKYPLYKVTKTITIGGHTILYVIRASARARRMAIKVTKDHKMEVVVPHSIPMEEGLKFVESQRNWIERHIDLLVNKEPKFLYMGNECKLIHTHSREDTRHKIFIEDGALYIDSPFGSTLPPKELYMQFLKMQGRKYLTSRCVELAMQHDFPVKKVSVRGQKSRWGSCSRRGTVSLNFKLMQLKPELIEYVIIHELCHLRQMNHSGKFWAEVARYVNNYRLCDKEVNKFRH